MNSTASLFENITSSSVAVNGGENNGTDHSHHRGILNESRVGDDDNNGSYYYWQKIPSSSTTLHRHYECSVEVSDGLFEFLIYGLFLNVISLLGVMGNTVSIIVLSRPQMKSSINFLLIGLATCDIFLIVLSVSIVDWRKRQKIIDVEKLLR